MSYAFGVWLVLLVATGTLLAAVVAVQAVAGAVRRRSAAGVPARRHPAVVHSRPVLDVPGMEQRSPA